MIQSTPSLAAKRASLQSIPHTRCRRLDGSLQNGPHYTANRGPDRGFVQYSSAFQLVMAKKESRRSSCPERRLFSLLCHSYRGTTSELAGRLICSFLFFLPTFVEYPFATPIAKWVVDPTFGEKLSGLEVNGNAVVAGIL